MSSQRKLVPTLSQEDREIVFLLATSGLVHFYSHQFENGMSDNALHKALESTLGTFGGSGGPDRLSVCYKGSGLKIWGGWQTINHVKTAPMFQGAATIAMAREVYQIADPDNKQMKLL